MEAKTTDRPGRPRDPDVHQAILEATRALLRERGYPRLSIEGVADRAGVGKTTIYRRWSTKGLLVAEAIFGRTKAVPMPDTGDVRRDIRIALDWGVAEVAAPEAKAALPGMLAELGTDPELKRSIQQGVLLPEYARTRAVLERGVERGQLSPRLDLDLVMDALIGTVFCRAVILDHPLKGEVLDNLVELVLGDAGKTDVDRKTRAHPK
jgi:AcrR family transcriptional regulator